MKTNWIWLVLVGSVIVSYGCAASLPRPAINPSNPIRTIAVLPMVNNSDDVEGPATVRKIFHSKIQEYHYEVKSIEETNEILNFQMGITLGKQLEMTTPQKLGETLGVDGVFYGYLLNFDEITTGVYNTYKVRMGWKLVNTKTGEIVWGKGVAVKREETDGVTGALASVGSKISNEDKVGPLPSSADPMVEMPGLGKWELMESRSSNTGFVASLGMSLGSKLFEGITGTRLKKEMEFAFRKLFSSNMLSGPGSSAMVAE